MKFSGIFASILDLDLDCLRVKFRLSPIAYLFGFNFSRFFITAIGCYVILCAPLFGQNNQFNNNNPNLTRQNFNSPNIIPQNNSNYAGSQYTVLPTPQIPQPKLNPQTNHQNNPQLAPSVYQPTYQSNTPNSTNNNIVQATHLSPQTPIQPAQFPQSHNISPTTIPAITIPSVTISPVAISPSAISPDAATTAATAATLYSPFGDSQPNHTITAKTLPPPQHLQYPTQNSTQDSTQTSTQNLTPNTTPQHSPQNPISPAVAINPVTTINHAASAPLANYTQNPYVQNQNAQNYPPQLPFPNLNAPNLNVNNSNAHNPNAPNSNAIATVGFVTPTNANNIDPTEPTNTTTQNIISIANNQQIKDNQIANNPVANNQITNNPVINNPVANNVNFNNSNSNIIVTNNPVAKTYKLQHLTGSAFETKLIKKLGQRFVPVRSIESSHDVVKYKLPVKDGSNVDFTIERSNGIVTVTGSSTPVESCVKIARLLDLPESKDGNVTEFMVLQNKDSAVLRQATGFINQSGQTAIKLVQNQPDASTPPPANTTANTTVNTTPANPAPANLKPETRFNPIAPIINDNNENKKNPNDNETTNTPNDSTNIKNDTILGTVQINIIDGLDTYVISGQPNDVAVVQRIIAQIDKISLEYEPEIELVAVKQADSLRVSAIVQQLYTQIYASRRGTIIMLPLVKPNTILMIGKKENLITAKELVNKLDLQVDPKSQFKIFRLKNAQAETLYLQISTFYNARTSSGYLEQQVNIIPDSRTNALIVQANPRDIQEVESLIKQLDVKGGETKNIVKTFQLKNAVANELVTTLQMTISGSSAAAGYAAAAATQTRNPLVTGLDKNGKPIQPTSILYDVNISADSRSNLIIVSAPPDTMVLIEMLINQLDQQPSAKSKIKIFTLVNADAYAIAATLTNLFSSTATSGYGTTGSTNANMMTTKRPGIEQDESTLVSVRFVSEIRTNSIIAIGSDGDLLTAEAILAKLDEENMNNRKIMTIKLLNTPASEIAPIIQQYVTNERSLETQNITYYMPQSPKEQYQKEVTVVAEPISNTLIISCTPRFYEQIRAIVQKIDERPRLVAVQGLIAEVKINNGNERGFEIGLQDSILFERSIGGLPGFGFGTNAALPTGNVRAGTVASQGISHLGVDRSGIGGFTFSASSESVSILMRALEEKDKLRVLSKPQLITTHNMRATVISGQRVPFVGNTTMSNYGDPIYTTEWQDVGTTLDITPRITADDQIVMALYVDRSSMGAEADGITTSYSSGNAIKTPKINQVRAQTTISAMDGQTIIIGGLITEQKESVNRSVPVLNKIPVVKHFFEYESQKTTRSELLIILTPTIIRSDADMEKLKQQEYARMHWCLNDVIKLTGRSEMRTRTDDWLSTETPKIKGTHTKLNESQLPPEENIKNMIPIKVKEE
ncbi:MAG: hypothetical protein LBP59_08045 [Planctomycetaceae bacterium]|jgi:type II secretion system protein D|nr:hypothetical protein [Planctomycetaceae bacterium]